MAGAAEYVDETLDKVLSLIGAGEQWIDSGVAWETRQDGEQTDGRVSFFVLTDHGLYFPVTRRAWGRAHHRAAAVDAASVSLAEAGRSRHGFLTLDLYNDHRRHRAGITFHLMASGGQEAHQAHVVASTLGATPDTFEYRR